MRRGASRDTATDCSDTQRRPYPIGVSHAIRNLLSSLPFTSFGVIFFTPRSPFVDPSEAFQRRTAISPKRSTPLSAREKRECSAVFFHYTRAPWAK
jgi:hypothetical protein